MTTGVGVGLAVVVGGGLRVGFAVGFAVGFGVGAGVAVDVGPGVGEAMLVGATLGGMDGEDVGAGDVRAVGTSEGGIPFDGGADFPPATAGVVGTGVATVFASGADSTWLPSPTVPMIRRRKIQPRSPGSGIRRGGIGGAGGSGVSWTAGGGTA